VFTIFIKSVTYSEWKIFALFVTGRKLVTGLSHLLSELLLPSAKKPGTFLRVKHFLQNLFWDKFQALGPL
jgi:hypothetical protein